MGVLLGALFALSFASLAATPGQALAAPAEFWTKTVGSTTPGARAVATSPTTGHIFTTDQSGRRVVEFTPWGAFVRTWGWDVAPAAAPGDTAADEFEICGAAEVSGCQAGVQGSSGVGQFNTAISIAVDSAGGVYVFDILARRVQKFNTEGEFLLMFGGNVNQGGGTPENPGNICTKEHLENGDVCGAGTAGSEPGQFGAPATLGNFITVTPDGKIYVGDDGRIQVFNSEGVYLGECEVAGEVVNQLAADSLGDLYLSFRKEGNIQEPDVRKLDPVSCELQASPVFEAENPRAIAVAEEGDVYVFDQAIAMIRHFDGTGAEVEPPFGAALNDGTTGLATSSACEIEGHDVYLANISPSFLRAYGPPPQNTDECPQPAVPPAILAQYATAVGTTSASLEAQINPSFWDDAAYYLEYGPDDCELSPCKRLLFPGASLTDELTNEAVRARVELSGLAPGATYHFRFIAQSGGGGPVFGSDRSFTTHHQPAPDTDCPNQAFRSGAAASLPDCRAYELVSPVDKNGGDIDAYFYEGFDAEIEFAGLDQATPSGSKLTYSASTSFADPEGAPAYPQYLATRTGGGWSSESIDPEMRGGIASDIINVDSQFKAFSEDLSTAWLKSESGRPLSPEATEDFQNLYRRDNLTATYTWLQSASEDPETCVLEECAGQANPYLFPELQGVSVGGGCATFRVNDALTPEAPRGVGVPGGLAVHQLYVWCEEAGLRLASRLPDGSPFEGTSSAGTEYDVLTAAFRADGRVNTVQNALSDDGSRIYWTASSAGTGAGEPSKDAAGRLYLRINADKEQGGPVSGGKCPEPATKACTLQVSHRDPFNESFFGPNEAQFWTASPSGERAIYSIVDGPDEGELHEYAFDPVEGKGANTPIAAETLGVAGWSEDAETLYFASREVCSSEANSEEAEAVEGAPNLYRQEVGQSCGGGELEFVGTLAEGDVSNAGNPTPSPLASVPRDHIARATPDGSHLAFVSAAPLTGYDNADAASGQPDRQVFLYDAQANEGEGELSCASCNPTGARPHGAELGAGTKELWTAAWIPGYQHQLYARRPLADDGQRLFFNSLDPLALRDSNGAQDVYQWQAPGSGSCTASSPTFSARNEGCIDLISSGQDKRDSEFVEASASGDDVFIRTEASLHGTDPGSVDIYDARAGGGFPEPAEPIACEGDSCQSVPSPPPLSSPASAAYRGPGNRPEAGECTAIARKAAGLSRRAKRLRRGSKRAGKPARARQMRRKAKRLARGAKRQSNRAKRCRRARR